MTIKIDRTSALLFIAVIVVMLALVMVMLRALDSSEESIAKIKNTKVEFDRAAGKYFDEDDCAARIKADLEAHPNGVTSAKYPAFKLNAKCMQYIAQMHTLENLSLADSVFDESLFSQISHLPLKSLDLRAAFVTDKILPGVAKLTTLWNLDLSLTHVTDDGIALLAPLKNLAYLNLDYTTVSDKSIPTILELANLRELHISNTKVTDSGLAALGNSKITVLGTDFIDLSASTLKHFSNLEFLDARHCNLKDDAIFETAKWRRLKRLDIADNSDLSDSAVVKLKGLKTLQYLGIDTEQFSAQALSEIKKANPHIRFKMHAREPSKLDF